MSLSSLSLCAASRSTIIILLFKLNTQLYYMFRIFYTCCLQLKWTVFSGKELYVYGPDISKITHLRAAIDITGNHDILV